jgi:hypothetical protein
MAKIESMIAAAVSGHIKALRLLDRSDTTVLSISEALGLPIGVVEQTLIDYTIPGAAMGKNRRAKVGEMSRIVQLKKRRGPSRT